MKEIFNKWSILFGLAAWMVAGCNTTSHKQRQTNYFPVTDTPVNSSSPYLSRDAKGTPVLSWVQENSKGETQVYFARYDTQTNQFGRPLPIPGSRGVSAHGEDMPKLVFDKKGKVMLAFAVKNPHPGNPYTGAVYYIWSKDGGLHWGERIPLEKDTTISYDQRYFDIALLSDGQIGMTWLSNSQPKGSTLYFAASDDSGYFSQKKTLAGHTCQCCRTALLVDKKGSIHVAWRNIFPGDIRDMAYCYSKDGGIHFSKPVRISADDWKIDGCPHTGPALAVNKEGLQVSWFTMGNGEGVFYCHSEKQPGLFSTKKTVSALPSARHPQMLTLANGNIAIVWDEGAKETGKFPHQRIGLQLRGPSGKVLTNGYLTAETGFATFPQIELLKRKETVLAFTENTGNQSRVCYKIVRL